MKIPEKTWNEYITRLSRLNQTAGQKMRAYIDQHGTGDTTALIAYAHALVTKYGEGSAELACQMYDALAEAEGVRVSAAEPADTASYGEVAKMVNATKQSPPQLQSGVSRLVKRTGADTTLKNARRDGAEFAWVPHGDTCAFCLALASNGWQKASEKLLKGGHAEHIHANCDCEFAVRFDRSTTVAGYDPEKYLAQYRAAGSDVNAIRRIDYAANRERINAQKRAAYAARKEAVSVEKSGAMDVRNEYIKKATPGIGKISYDPGYDSARHTDEIKTAQWLHDHLGGDIVLLNESNVEGEKRPDYFWRETLWDLKTASSEKSANSSIRHGLQQIRENPGGIILNFGSNEFDPEILWNVIDKRMQWNRVEGNVDIMILSKDSLYAVKRYNKK